MKLENSFTVPVPIDQAWQVLQDVERIAPCMPGAASWVKLTSASVKPTAARPSRYSATDSAPAMQPT